MWAGSIHLVIWLEESENASYLVYITQKIETTYKARFGAFGSFLRLPTAPAPLGGS